jgi:hypothetical protein
MSAICGIKETQIVLRRNTIEQFKPYINPLHRAKKKRRLAIDTYRKERVPGEGEPVIHTKKKRERERVEEIQLNQLIVDLVSQNQSLSIRFFYSLYTVSSLSTSSLVGVSQGLGCN